MATKKDQETFLAKIPEPHIIPVKTIRIAISDDVLITETERKIIDTPAFQRLRRIKQLGTSYLIYPSAVHSRFEHSLGTLKMADTMVQKIRASVMIQEKKGFTGLPNIDDYDRQIIRLAALLHDITQIPFAHTLEDESHVIEPDHDSDEDRFDHFLGKNKDIGKILVSQVGKEGHNLLMNVLKSRKEAIESLGKKAYICDIVKNTVCADLLDYLKRDAYYCNLNLDYGDRFLNFLFLSWVPSSKPGGKDSIRLIIRVWKEKEKRHRRDIIDELIHLLNNRFFLGSAVYFHHAKIITSAMISRAVKQALNSRVFTKEELWDMGDDELLHCLVNNSKDKIAKRLAKCLLERIFYEDFFEFSRSEAETAEEVRLLDILEEKFHKNSTYRMNEEDRLSRVYSDKNPGDVLIYCPNKNMALKEAEMLILWKKNHMPLSKIEDKLAKEKVKSILDSHKQLWCFKVFVSPTLKNEMENNLLNEALLREWCYDIVKVGEDKERHFRSMIDVTILDILQNKGEVSSEISQLVCDKVTSRVAELRQRGSGEPITRKYIESVIEDFLSKRNLGNEKH